MVEHLGLLEIRAMENLFFWENKKLNKKLHNLPTRKNRLWNQYVLIKKVGVLMSCLKAVQHPNHLSPFLRRCPHDRGRVERLGVMTAGHQPGCPRLNLETQRRFFGMVTAPYAPL